MRSAALCLAIAIMFVCPIAPAQWVQTNGPYGGSVSALASSGTQVYAATGSAGIFRSTNNGATWADANSGLTTTEIRCLVPHGGAVLAGTRDGVFRSTDNGASWNPMNSGLAYRDVLSLRLSGAYLLAGVRYYGGVFRSSDGGSNWTQTNLGLPSDIWVNSFAVSGTSVFAGTSSGVFRSTNDGSSWTPANSGLPSDGWVSCLAVSGTNLIAGLGSSSAGSAFLSTDNGTSWIPVDSAMPHSVLSLCVSGMKAFAGTYMDGVYLSTDNGATWVPRNTGMKNTYVFSLLAEGERIFAGTSAGVFVSTNDGASWTTVNTGLVATDVRALTVNETSLWAGTLGGGVFHSPNGGSAWTALTSEPASPWVSSVGVIGPNVVAGISGYYYESYSHGVFRSSNMGTSWDQVADFGPSSFAVSGTDLFAGGGGVLHSADSGATWKKTSLDSAYVTALAVSGTSILAGTYLEGAFLSIDSGESWSNIGLKDYDINSLAVIGADIFAGTYGVGVLRTTDNGITWTSASTGLTGGVLCLAGYGTNLFAGTEHRGVFLSTNNGTSWTEVNTGLPIPDAIFNFPYDYSVYALAVQGSNLFVGVMGRGVWRRPLSEVITSIDLLVVELPQEFVLLQNYPNPFNPSTTIRYGLPSRSNVTLSVFNTLGQQVATLVQEEQEAGYHEALFDASGLASGVYLYRLTAGSFVETRKLVLVR